MKNEITPSVHVVSLRMYEHAKASGYDRLVDFLGCPVIAPVREWTFTRRAVTRLLRFALRRSGSTWYHRESLLTELHAAREWLKKRGQVFHFLYGENSYRYLGAMKPISRRNRIVCTYHTPPDIFRTLVQDRQHLRRLDAIITMSTAQNEFFSEFVGERVFFVPHGVDVDYFQPNPTRRAESGVVGCLFVGSYLRDLETLARAAAYVGQRTRDVHFSVVTRPESHHHFQGLRNVELYSGVPDEKLLEMYHGADLFVLPLKDCTANNSLLEAIACGLPMVATDLQGVRDYTCGDCAVLTPKGDAEALGDTVLDLAGDAAMRTKMGRASRQQALNFRWERVAEHVWDVYRKVSNSLPP